MKIASLVFSNTLAFSRSWVSLALISVMFVAVMTAPSSLPCAECSRLPFSQ